MGLLLGTQKAHQAYISPFLSVHVLGEVVELPQDSGRTTSFPTSRNSHRHFLHPFRAPDSGPLLRQTPKVEVFDRTFCAGGVYHGGRGDNSQVRRPPPAFPDSGALQSQGEVYPGLIFRSISVGVCGGGGGGIVFYVVWMSR